MKGVREVKSGEKFQDYKKTGVPFHSAYIYPKPNASGVFNIFGKERIGPFSSVDDPFSEDVSETFLLYLQYYFAKFLCSQYNAPWQAQKEELLRSYKRLVDSENNISYQETSINSGCDLLPLRNIRIGL